MDYNPIPPNVRAAHEAFVAVAKSAGLYVTPALLHSTAPVSGGEAASVGGRAVRYWPALAAHELSIVGPDGEVSP